MTVERKRGPCSIPPATHNIKVLFSHTNIRAQSTGDILIIKEYKSWRILPLCISRQFYGVQKDTGYEEVLTVDDNTGMYALMPNDEMRDFVGNHRRVLDT